MTSSNPVQLAIVGAGAAGLYGAAVAASKGVRTVLVERKSRIGTKLLMTANGRCNFTKNITAAQMLKDICGSAGKWLETALTDCPPAQIIRAMKAAGVQVKYMPDGRAFPETGQASTVVHAFGDMLRDMNVPLLTNCAVRGIAKVGKLFTIDAGAFSFEAENVLVATGGITFPKTGSVGDGQNFARSMGHHVTPYRPGLIGYLWPVGDAKAKCAIPVGRYEDGESRVYDGDGKLVFSCRAVIDVETWGIGGAAIYNAERFAMHNRLGRGWSVEAVCNGRCVRLVEPETRPMKEAIVTIGGVSLDEVDGRTMESKIVPGLYFAGEVLDIDGPTGGYNLSMAFATARQAVTNCSLKLARR